MKQSNFEAKIAIGLYGEVAVLSLTETVTNIVAKDSTSDELDEQPVRADIETLGCNQWLSELYDHSDLEIPSNELVAGTYLIKGEGTFKKYDPVYENVVMQSLELENTETTSA